jgi:methylated-DNA-[protein]-cysteine S-methyltransferase
MNHYALFETPLGFAAIAWSPAGLTRVLIPEPNADAARRALLRRIDAVEAPVPPALQPTVDKIGALLRGEAVDFADAPLASGVTSAFNARVYAIARRTPPGETTTYGAIATELGDRLLARDVGAAMGQNPWPIVIPCHRVTAAGGKIGGFSAHGGAATKLKLLRIEGAQIAREPAPKAQPQADLFG